MLLFKFATIKQIFSMIGISKKHICALLLLLGSLQTSAGEELSSHIINTLLSGTKKSPYPIAFQRDFVVVSIDSLSFGQTNNGTTEDHLHMEERQVELYQRSSDLPAEIRAERIHRIHTTLLRQQGIPNQPHRFPFPHQYIAWQRTDQAETDHAKGLESPIHIGLLPATPILQNDSRREQQEDNYLQKQRDIGGVQLHPHQQAMVPD